MAKNDWAKNAFRKAQNLMSTGYNDFEPATVVTKNDLNNLKSVLLSDNEIEKENELARKNNPNWYKFPDYEATTNPYKEDTPIEEVKELNSISKALSGAEEEATSLSNWGDAYYNVDASNMNMNPWTNQGDFHSLIQDLENEKKEGWTGNHWAPHNSVEGGNQTIAYGHKLSDVEQNGGYVNLGGEQVPFAELTEEKGQELYQQDWDKAETVAESWFDKDWDILDENAKLYATELVYNMGDSVTKGNTEYKKFKQKAVSGEDYLSEIGRTYVNKKGKRVPLTSRVNKLKTWNN
tara:strand:+ start:323 stop:1201 length:879 start_codon:yes stop_codon:yes gene_type:complete